MDNNLNVTELHKPVNPLNELLKQGVQQLLAQAIEAEVQALLEQFSLVSTRPAARKSSPLSMGAGNRRLVGGKYLTRHSNGP